MKKGNIILGEEVDFTQFKWNTKQLDEFRKRFDCIVSFLKKPITTPNIQLLLSDCTYLAENIFLPLTPVDVNHIIRARPNKEGKIFKEEWEISYNSRNTDGIPLSRFNLRKQSMFYGAVRGSQEQARWLATVSLECCKEVVDSNNFDPVHYFTLGKWEVQRQFPVLNLCFNDYTLKFNPGLKKHVDHYLDEINSKLPSKTALFLKEYWYFLSDLACSKAGLEQQYCITTCFMLAIRSTYQDEFYGIVYPSSMTDNEGINIVLTPEAVNTHLRLIQVLMYKLVRDKGNHNSYLGAKCSKTVPVQYGSFKLEPFLEDQGFFS